MNKSTILICWLCWLCLAKSGFAAKPNIVIILADDMGPGDVSALNPDAGFETPHIDRLVREGLALTHGHSSSAVCTPTRYSLLTGRYSWRTRLKRGVLNGRSKALIDPSQPTLASVLKPAGYHSAMIGKWHLGWNWPMRGGKIDFTDRVAGGPDANGFDYYFGHCGSLDMPPYVYVENGKVTAEPNRTTGRKVDYAWWRPGPTGADFVHEEVLPEFTRRGADYIRKRAAMRQPFFLYLPLPAPHTPILPTEEFKGKSGINPYADFCMQVDHTVGEILKALDETGVADNTLVIFTADNGCSPQAKFPVLHAAGHRPGMHFRGHKADIFEGGHRVPFVLRWPGMIKPGGSNNTPVSQVDLLATCAEAAGVEPADTVGPDSVSLMPLLRGAKSLNSAREAIVVHSISGRFGLIFDKWKLCFCPGSGGWSAPKDASARKKGLPEWQLYNLQTDPSEKTNLMKRHPEVLARGRSLLRSYIERGRSTPGPEMTNHKGKIWWPQLPWEKPVKTPRRNQGHQQ